MKKIKAFIVNRNLFTTLKNTVEFLSKEPRIDIVIFDQQSTYPPLLEYYNDSNLTVVYSKENNGPHSVWWEGEIRSHFNDNYFIVADSDCLYDNVPDDWLDKMINVLESTSIFKVGFSLEIDDLPDTELTKQVKNWESQFWIQREDLGWKAGIDTTFALYRPNSHFDFHAIRLDKPYCIKHVFWYLTPENITDEWRYYLKEASGVSSWGSKLKSIMNIN